MQEVPSSVIPVSKPKTEEIGGGWFSYLCPSVLVNFTGGVRQMFVRTDACEDIEKERIQQKLTSPDIKRFDQPPIGERKAAKAKEEVFRKRMREETTLSKAEQKKYIHRFQMREALVDINYDKEIRLKKTLNVLGSQNSQAIERGRTINEPPIIKRDIIQVEEAPLSIIIKQLEPSELLKLVLKVDITTEEEKAQKKGPVGSFEKEVYKPNQEHFKKIFDTIQEVLEDPKRFPDFNRKEFDRIKFEKDPVSFLIEINSSHDRKDLKFIVDEIAEGDQEFLTALNTISLANQEYFKSSLFAARAFDEEYMADAKNYDKFQYILEELNELNENKSLFELEDLEAAFKEIFGSDEEAVELRCAAKEKEHFDVLFNELVKNDSEYQAAQKIVQDILSKYPVKESFDASDFFKLFLEDKEFREAYHVVNKKYQAVCAATGFQFKYNANFEIDPVEYAESLIQKGIVDAAKYVKNHPGRFLYTPAAVLGSAVIGWQVTPILMGAVVTGHVLKKAAPAAAAATTEILEKSGFFYDIRQARLDRAFGRPFREILYSEGFRREQKIEALQVLHNKNLLFQEDLKLTDFPSDLLKVINVNKKDLTSIKEIENIRKKPLKILDKDVFATNDMRLNALKEMADTNVLYRNDILNQDSNIQKAFFKQNDTRLEDFPDIEEESKLRNNNLFIAKGVAADNFKKLEAIKMLHEKGVFFKEDLIKLQKDFPHLYEEVVDQGLTLDKLPEPAMRYKTELSLKAEHDKIREGILSKEGNLLNGIPTLKGLQELYKEGLCFKHDLANIDTETKTSFAEFLSKYPLADTIDSLPDQEDFYQYGLAKRIVKFGDAVSKIIWEGGEAVYNNPANIVYGPLKAVKGITVMTAEALEETFGTFTDIKTTALSDRISSVLPGDKNLKAHATYAFNKTIGTIKWSAIGAGIGATLSSLFGITGATFGMQIGGAIGSFFGACTTDGTVSQIPKGGFIRAIKFASYGTLIGAVVAVVLIAAGPVGWAVGAVTLSAAIIVASASSSLVVPLVILGAVSGYYYAGLTGKDETKEEEKDITDILKYNQPNIEPAFLAAVPV